MVAETMAEPRASTDTSGSVSTSHLSSSGVDPDPPFNTTGSVSGCVATCPTGGADISSIWDEIIPSVSEVDGAALIEDSGAWADSIDAETVAEPLASMGTLVQS